MNMDLIKPQVDLYLESKSQNPDTWIIHCSKQLCLKDAIAFAALAENHLGKRHPHQYRRKKTSLENFAAIVIDHLDLINQVGSFQELFSIVEDCKVTDIGPLTIYDTATRIGAYLKIYPEKIYLHTGTRLGAEKLLGRKIKSDFLERSELPAIFQDPRITCADIEDILCHLKNRSVDERIGKTGNVRKKYIC